MENLSLNEEILHGYLTGALIGIKFVVCGKTKVTKLRETDGKTNHQAQTGDHSHFRAFAA
jgi:hypothetical protein